MSPEAANRIHALLLTASRAVDESVVVAQADLDALELREFKKSARRVLATLMDEMMLTIYREHPELVPPQLDRRLLRL